MKQTIYISGDEKNKGLRMLPIIELIGVEAGAFAFRYAEKSEILRRYICPELFSGASFEYFVLTLTILCTLLAASFFSGISAFGQPFGIALLMGTGAHLGCSAAMIYSEKGISAIPTVLILFLPKALGISALAILSVRELMRCSCGILGSMTGTDDPPRLKLYLLRHLVLFSGALLLSVIMTIADHFLRHRL